MEPIHDPHPARGVPPPAEGELVVQNGRLAGARRPLALPLTFVGKAACCDIRLSMDGIAPLHCLIAAGPSGLLVRDLDSETGTLVNGERITTCPICDGDLLTVGPFQFRLRLAKGPGQDGQTGKAADDGEAAREKEALRIQTAAVAAQQVALAEEEARLQQRRGALEQQESQLATHLEDRRRRLLQVAEQAQTARTALQKERADYERHVEKVTTDLSQAQRELLEAQKKAQAERQRLIELRKRLKQRWHRHWAAERSVIRQREDALAAERRHLEKENDLIQQGKVELAQARLRFNGEVEIGKRQLQADRELFRQEQQHARERLANDLADLAERESSLAGRVAAVADAERLLDDEQYRWEKGLGLLKRETEGLENRIRNQRRKAVEQQQEIDRLEARLRGLQGEAAKAPLPPPAQIAAPAGPAVPAEGAVPGTALADSPAPDEQAAPAQPTEKVAAPKDASASSPVLAETSPPEPAPVAPPPVPSLPVPVESSANPFAEIEAALAEKEGRLREAEVALPRRVAMLERLVEELADQRLILSEQWQRLAGFHHEWHRERAVVQLALEAVAACLPARVEEVVARDRALQAAEDDLRRRHQEAVQLRHHLEGWKARLHIRESGWESERDRALVDVRGREELLQRHLAALVEVRQRWAKRRRKELELVRAERAACERLRQECAALRDELWQRGNALEEERRLLAQKTLALEQYRQFHVLKAADAAAAERRVERLRRRWVAQNANLVRATIAERQALQQEVARLEDRSTALHKQMESLTVREAGLAQRQTAWEEAQALAEFQQDKLRQELQSMQAQRDRYALHLIELQDEVERVARILLEEPELALTHAPQAA
jgi:hypothetical protein